VTIALFYRKKASFTHEEEIIHSLHFYSQSTKTSVQQSSGFE